PRRLTAPPARSRGSRNMPPPRKPLRCEETRAPQPNCARPPRPLPHAAQPKSGTLQPKMKRAAPPACRPQPQPKVLQAKTPSPAHTSSQPRRAPAAPPVYKPQPAPKALQMKTAEGRRADEGASRRQTLAPPVYRPKQEKSVRPQAGQPGLLQGRPHTVQPRPAQAPPKGRAVQPSMPAGAPVKSPAAAKPQGNVARHQPAAEQRRDAFSRVIQRRVRIQNIDYDPERSAF